MNIFDGVSERFAASATVGVIPTDTVYGLAARATDNSAVVRLYQLKHRESKPGTLIAASIEQLEQLGLKRRYLTAVSQFWPGAVSVVISCGPELDYLDQHTRSLAVRIPDNVQLRALLTQTGPLITSSANNPGEPTATTVEKAQNYFHDQVDFYIDGGDLSNHQASTIIRIIDDEIEILRQGAVIIQQ